MKKELEQISSRMFISMQDILHMPKEELQEIVNRQLVRGLAEVIIDEMETLPVTYIKETEVNTGGEVHKIRINIISDEELKRLHSIEENEELNQLREFNPLDKPYKALLKEREELKEEIAELKLGYNKQKEQQLKLI